MTEFLETICFEEGNACCLQEHEARMNATRRHFWPDEAPLQLASFVTPQSDKGRLRCRVVYHREIVSVNYYPYTPRPVHSLQCIDIGTGEYAYKYADRSMLDAWYAQRGEADDVLLLRNGLLTDTSIANVALWNGSEWHTPEKPLLAGTHRARLLQNGVLKPRLLRVEDLDSYETIVLFNAMLHFGEVQLSVSAIRM